MPLSGVPRKTILFVAISLVAFAPRPRVTASEKLTSSLERTRPQHQDSLGDPLPPHAVARLGSTCLRHVRNVHDACLTPDGKLLCTCTYQGDVWVWDTTTGKLRRFFPLAPNGVYALACSPDGRSLAGVGSWQQLYVWQLSNWEMKEFPIPGLTENCTAITFSPDGKSLAVAAGQRVALWDVPGYRPRHVLTWAKLDAYPPIAFSPDGKVLAVGTGRSPGAAAPIHLWDTKTGAKIGEFEGHQGGVWSVSFSADGKSLVSRGGMGAEHSTRLWDLNTRRNIKQFDRNLMHLFYTPGGKNLVSGADDGTVRIWNPQSGKELFKGVVAEGPRYLKPAFSADGKTMATWSRNSTVRLWSISSGKELLQRAGHAGAVLALTFTPDGKGLLSRGGDVSYRFWDWRAAKEIRRYPWDTGSTDADVQLPGHLLALSPDGTLLAGESPDRGTLGLWEVHTGKVRAAMPGDMRGSCDLAFTPGGDGLLFCTGRWVGLWSVRSAKEIALFDLEPGVQVRRQVRNACMATSPDGETLAVWGHDRHFRFWNWRTGALLRQVEIPVRSIGTLAYSPDGSILASCGRAGLKLPDPTVRLWDPATGKLLRALIGHKGAVVSVAFSPDGKVLASAGEEDRTVRLWSVFTGEELARFEGHTGPVYCVAFSPDGRVLASGSGDTTILLWDLRDVKAPSPKPVVDAATLARLWDDLNGDPSRAYAATWALAGGGDKAVALLRGHLRPASPPDAGRVRKLLDDLGSNDFPVREAATKELARLGRPVEAAVRQRLAEGPAPEVRKRLQSILTQVRSAQPSASSLRDFRAVQVLELIGSAEARALLKELAAGAPGASLTRDAKAALRRLDRAAAKRED